MAEEIVSRRELIISEIWKRIAAIFPESGIERGLAYEQIVAYDKFYILDLPESCDLSDRHRGMYHCMFTVSITYWLQMSREEVYSAGNILMEKIRYAIETDENLNKLVVSYHLDEGALVWYDEGVLDVELLYVVEYTKDAGWVSNPFKTR